MSSMCVEISLLDGAHGVRSRIIADFKNEMSQREYALLTSVAINSMFPEQNRNWSSPLDLIILQPDTDRDCGDYQSMFDRLIHAVGVQQYVIKDRLQKIHPGPTRADIYDDRNLILYAL